MWPSQIIQQAGFSSLDAFNSLNSSCCKKFKLECPGIWICEAQTLLAYSVNSTHVYCETVNSPTDCRVSGNLPQAKNKTSLFL